MGLTQDVITKINKIWFGFKDFELGEEINKGVEAKEILDAWQDPIVTVKSFVFPIIEADTQEDIQVNLGELNTNTEALIQFVEETVTQDDIANGVLGAGDIEKVIPVTTTTGTRSNTPYKKYIIGDDGQLFFQSTLLVFEDYLKARRFGRSSTTNEKYGDSATTLPDGKTSEQIGVDVIVGYWDSIPYGCFLSDAKIELQRIWLTQDNGDTILNMRFYNQDGSASTTTRTINIAIYE